MAQTSANTYLLGNMNNGFVFYGNKKGEFTVTAYDANHIAIIGPGAPAINVTATSGVSITPPAPGTPNVWAAQNVVFDSFEFITLTATPLIGPPVTAHVPFITHHVSVYAVTQSGVRTPSDALVGPLAEAAINSFRVDGTYLGVHGFDPEAGLTTPNIAEAQTNRTLIGVGAQLTVLADHTKYREVGTNVFARMRRVDNLIVDDGLALVDRGIIEMHVGRLTIATVQP